MYVHIIVHNNYVHRTAKNSSKTVPSCPPGIIIALMLPVGKESYLLLVSRICTCSIKTKDCDSVVEVIESHRKDLLIPVTFVDNI